MEHLCQVLQSYFHLRTAVLRAITKEQWSTSGFVRITGLNGDAKYRRQKNADLWKPAEIHQLAIELGLSDEPANRLEDLALIIQALPELARKDVCKIGKLTSAKLQERLQDPKSWQAQELTKLRSLLTGTSLQRRALSKLNSTQLVL